MYSCCLSRHQWLATLTSRVLGSLKTGREGLLCEPERDLPQAEEGGCARQGSYLDGRHVLSKRPSPTPRVHEELYLLQPDQSLLRRTQRVEAKAWGANMIIGSDSISSLFEEGRLHPGGQLVL